MPTFPATLSMCSQLDLDLGKTRMIDVQKSDVILLEEEVLGQTGIVNCNIVLLKTSNYFTD